MEFGNILLIPKLGKGGGQFREKLLSFSMGSPGRSVSVGMSGKSSQAPSNPTEISITLPFNESASFLYLKVVKGETIPEMRIEINEVTKTTLKNSVTYDFINAIASSFSISERGSNKEETILVTFVFDSMKATFNK